MALKLTLKPQERIILGGAVVRNAGLKPSSLLLENKIPLLRESRILAEKDANTPAKRLYFSIQLMYVTPSNAGETKPIYVALLQDLAREAPSMSTVLNKVSEAVLGGDYYEALRHAWVAIERERELIENAKSCSCDV